VLGGAETPRLKEAPPAGERAREGVAPPADARPHGVSGDDHALPSRRAVGPGRARARAAFAAGAGIPGRAPVVVAARPRRLDDGEAGGRTQRRRGGGRERRRRGDDAAGSDAGVAAARHRAHTRRAARRCRAGRRRAPGPARSAPPARPAAGHPPRPPARRLRCAFLHDAAARGRQRPGEHARSNGGGGASEPRRARRRADAVALGVDIGPRRRDRRGIVAGCGRGPTGRRDSHNEYDRQA